MRTTWGNDVDEIWQQEMAEEIIDAIGRVKKRRGPKTEQILLQFGGTVVQVDIRRVRA